MLFLIGSSMSIDLHASVATGVIVPVPSSISTTYPYMLYLPSSYNPGASTVWPLIICLDGLGQDGDGSSDGTLSASGTNQLAYVLQLGPLEFINSGSTYFNDNAIIIQPQSTNGTWSVANLNNTINQVAGATQGAGLYNVDFTRMYLLVPNC
jgi:predicted peptidase